MATVNIFDMADTWNNVATTYTAIKMNVTDTASNASSLLLDLQVGGASAFNVTKGGSVKLGINSSGTNVAGTNVVIAGSQGTGSGAGGSIIFQVAPAGSSGTAQNALATALTITGTQRVQAASWFDAQTGIVVGSGAADIILAPSATYWLTLRNTATLGWASGDATATRDTILARDAANTLALRNGTNAQSFRVYNTFDGTNNEWVETSWSGSVAYLLTDKTGTGTRRKIYVGGVGVRLDPTPASGGTVEILAANISTDTTTGMKIGTATTQKLGFYNATPIVQPTTAVAEAAFVENSGGTAVNVDSTFDGYTIQQVVKALRNTGLLA